MSYYPFWIKTGGLGFLEIVFTDIQSHNCLEGAKSDILNNDTQNIYLHLFASVWQF